MLNTLKGIVASEELKQQLAESGMSNATKEMVNAAKDIGLISKELEGVDATKAFYKLQEQGMVISEEILPAFAKRLKAVAAVGLDKKLESNAVAMQRLVNATLPMVGNEFFKAGWGDGLTDLFNTISENVVDLIPLFKSLGKITGSMAHGLARLVDLITPPLRVLGNLLDWLTDKTGDFSAVVATFTTFMVIRFLPMIASFGTAGKVFKGIVISSYIKPLLLLLKTLGRLMLFEEVVNMFTRDKEGKFVGKGNTSTEQNINADWSATNLLGDKFSFLDTSLEDLWKGITNKFGSSSNQIQAMPRQENQSITIQGNVYLDKEQVGSVLSTADGFKNGVATTIYPILQGGQ